MKAPLPKNPFVVTQVPLLPPGARGRVAMGLAVAAARGRFMLQVCGECGTVQYPPREACVRCLGHDLPWRDVDTTGSLLAETTLRVAADPYFRAHLPWRIGLVALGCGPKVVAHLHRDVAPMGPTRLKLMLDKSGQAVMLAMPPQDTPEMLDDPELRELTCDPAGRRVLVTDGTSELGRAMARAMLGAGARSVFAGVADEWRPRPRDLAGVETVPLDLSDTESVHRLAAAIGGRVEIVINTARYMRPGGIASGDLVTAREQLEWACIAPMRLARYFGPALRARAADGTHPACAWVNIISATALAPPPGLGAYAAAQAAALSISNSLRGELRPIRVLDAITGPIDDEWHQSVPPPKVAPAALADAVLRGLRGGLELVVAGDAAQDLVDRWAANPALLAHELSS